MLYRSFYILILPFSVLVMAFGSLDLICAKGESQNAEIIDSPFILTDSLPIPFDSVIWNEPLDFAVIHGDTLFADTFILKNNYRLILFPVAEGYTSEDEIAYEHYARLTGEGIDTILMNSFATSPSKYWLRYDNIDFDDYFVIENSGGGNYMLYTNIIEKKTGKIEVGLSIAYDTDNQLMLYYGDEIMLYDLKINKKTEIETAFEHPCFGGMGYWTRYEIAMVTPDSVYVSYDGCDEPVTIKIKR